MEFSDEQLLSTLKLLQNTISDDNAARKYAEETLTSNEQQESFVYQILLILENPLVDHQLKYVTITYLKNMIIRLWKREPPLFSSNTKLFIKQKTLMVVLGELAPQTKSQSYQILAKIAKMEYPEEWGALFEDICKVLQNQTSEYRQIGVLHLFLECLRAICQDETSPAFAHLKKESEMLFSILFTFMQYYKKVSSLTDPKSPLLSCFFMCQKILGKFLTWDLIPFTASPSTEYIKEVFAVLELFDKAKTDVPEVDGFLEQTMANAVKTVVKCQKKFPLQFVPYLKSCFKNFFFLCRNAFTDGNEKNRRNSSERILVPCLNFFHNILIEPMYRTKENAPLLKGLFVPEAVLELCRFLVLKFMKMTPYELQLWNEDSAAFLSEELSSSWSNHRKAAAEVLFNTLAKKHAALVAPFIYEILKQAHSEQNSEATILVKESCYWAISMAFYELRTSLNFSQLFDNFLKKDFELVGDDLFGRVLKRRMIMIIEAWSSGVNTDIRPLIYSLLVQCMKTKDYVVKLYSALALRNMMDDSEFEISVFETHVETFMTETIKLAEGMLDYNASTEILGIIAATCSVLGDKVKQYCGFILDNLSKLWVKSIQEEGHSLKIGILRCMKKLVKLLRIELDQNEELLYTFAAPIEYCIKPAEENNNNSSVKSLKGYETLISLSRDALLLWEELLLVTDNFDKPSKKLLLQMFPKLIRLTELRDNENVSVCMKLLDLYLSRMYSTSADPLLSSLSITISGFKLSPTLGASPPLLLSQPIVTVDVMGMVTASLEIVYKMLSEKDRKDVMNALDYISTIEVLESLVLFYPKEIFSVSCFVNLWQTLLHRIVNAQQLDETQKQCVSYYLMVMFKLFLNEEQFIDLFFPASKNLLDIVFEATLQQLEGSPHEAEVSKTCCLGLTQLLLKCDQVLLTKFYVRLLKIFAKILETESEASEEYHKCSAKKEKDPVIRLEMRDFLDKILKKLSVFFPQILQQPELVSLLQM